MQVGNVTLGKTRRPIRALLRHGYSRRIEGKVKRMLSLEEGRMECREGMRKL